MYPCHFRQFPGRSRASHRLTRAANWRNQGTMISLSRRQIPRWHQVNSSRSGRMQGTVVSLIRNPGRSRGHRVSRAAILAGFGTPSLPSRKSWHSRSERPRNSWGKSSALTNWNQTGCPSTSVQLWVITKNKWVHGGLIRKSGNFLKSDKLTVVPMLLLFCYIKLEVCY